MSNSCDYCSRKQIFERKKKEFITPFKMEGECFISCDYCSRCMTLCDFIDDNPIEINYVKYNIVFELKFHNYCFDIFSKVNQLVFCDKCLNYSSSSGNGGSGEYETKEDPA